MSNGSLEYYYASTFERIEFSNIKDASILIENIVSAEDLFRNETEDIIDYLISNYLREVWLGEFPPDVDIDTIEITDLLVEGASKPENLSDRVWMKLNNLHKAVKYFLMPPESYDVLSVEFVKHIHTLIGQGVIDDCGSYRTKKVCANNSKVFYASPSSISFRIEKLFEFVKTKVANVPASNPEKLAYMFRLGAFLFSEFLLIHPFSNGNGRTARVLLNAFFRGSIIIPFSLYTGTREDYIDTLEKRSDLSPPSDLASYLLICCNRTASQVNWLCLK